MSIVKRLLQSVMSFLERKWRPLKTCFSAILDMVYVHAFLRETSALILIEPFYLFYKCLSS